MKPKVYLETTIPSYLSAKASRDLIVAAHQQITQEWWERRRNQFDIFISQFVLSSCHGLPLDMELRAHRQRGNRFACEAGV